MEDGTRFLAFTTNQNCDQERVEIRRYRLHHSMNALLWHDHGDRVMWPA